MALNQIALDSNKNIIYNPKPLAIRQGEKGVTLPVVLTAKNIGVKDLISVNLNFEATKPDGKIILDENQDHFTKSDGYFEYVLPAEVYQAVGEVKGHFILKYNDDVIDTTSDFSIKVLSRTGQDEKSSDYISAAETIVEESRKKLQQIIDVVITATDQVDLTKSNLTGDVSKFLSDTQTTVNSNIKTLTDNLNQLKNTFNSNITSAEGVFKSKKSEIDDWFTAKQVDYTAQKQFIDSEWSAKKAEKDNDWLKLKASYDNKISSLTNQYQQSVDAQKQQLSDDLSSFKSQLKSQLDSTQSTINQLKNTDVPAISKKLDSIRADIDKIDLDSVKKKADDAYTIADSTAKKVDEFDSKLSKKAENSRIDDLDKYFAGLMLEFNRRSTTNSYDINNLKKSKPDLSGYYQKSETLSRQEIENKDLAVQNQAVELVKSQLVGDKSNLTTDDRSSVVSAINWLYQKINGAFDLSSPVVPYVNDSANYTNQNMIYLNSSGSYNFDNSHVINYDSNFANSTLSNIGDGLKLWVKLRKKAYINGVQQADNNDYPVSYSSSDYVNGQFSASVQSPIIINKSDIVVSSPSESKTIVVELSGVGEMATGSKLAPKLKITNKGDSNTLVVESIQGYNFDNPNSPNVNGAYYDLDVDRVAEFGLIRTPVRSLVSGTSLMIKKDSKIQISDTIFDLSNDFKEVGDGIKLKFEKFMYLDKAENFTNNIGMSVFSKIPSEIVKEYDKNTVYIKIPKKLLINGFNFSTETNGNQIVNQPSGRTFFNYGVNKVYFKIGNKQIIISAQSYSNNYTLCLSDITTYKNNVLFDGGYKIGKSTNDVTISKKLNELKNGLIIKIDKLKLETKEYTDIDLLKRALKSSDDVSVTYEENPNFAILTIPKSKIATGTTVQTANVGEVVRDNSGNWLYSSGGTNQKLNINFKNDNTINFSAGLYTSNDSAIFISEIQEY
ncbi:BppU family phage baseplate upper protein [Holzapfeliella sp. JNUCC 80]